MAAAVKRLFRALHDVHRNLGGILEKPQASSFRRKPESSLVQRAKRTKPKDKQRFAHVFYWIPAFAGMAVGKFQDDVKFGADGGAP
jgi:hypothetical protein